MPLTQKLNFKTSSLPLPSLKNVLNKITLTTEDSSTVLQNLFLLDTSVFNDLVIKNYPVKKAKTFFVLMEGVQLHHGQVLA